MVGPVQVDRATHGQNVSAYARSLPEGPGRGRLLSAAARTECGRPGD